MLRAQTSRGCAHRSRKKLRLLHHDTYDKPVKKRGKAIVRHTAKLFTKTTALVAEAPAAVVSGTVNGAINVVNTSAKLVTGAVLDGVANSAVRAYYNVQKIAPATKRAWYKIPSTLAKVKDVWQIPGAVLQKTGQTMQDNRPMKDKK